MIRRIAQWFDSLMGHGDAAPTIPLMDGALHPNSTLDEAESVYGGPCPDNLVFTQDRLFFSSGNRLLALDVVSNGVTNIREFEHEITSLAYKAGTFAAGTEDGSLHVWSEGTQQTSPLNIQAINCPTALTFDGNSDLIVCNGSRIQPASKWKHDLMALGSTGSVHAVSLRDRSSRELAGGLGFPFGVVRHEDDIIVSEAWRHRIVALSGKAPRPLLADLPGYPSRIVPSEDGGYWLAVFAPRRQLVEFVLREPVYRHQMLQEVDDAYWIAPSLSAPRSFLEPMFGGALRSHGILKPWAPTRSYGLLIRLDRAFKPIFGWHSRADGRRHGITSCVDTPVGIFVASRGGDEILRRSAAYGEEDDAP